MITRLALSVALLVSLLASRAEASDPVPLRIGFPMSSFVDGNMGEARIAVNVFLKHAFNARDFDYSGSLYKTDTELLEALDNGEIDFISMNPSFYERRGRDLPISPIAMSQRGPEPTENLVLVTSQSNQLSALQGCSLVIDNSARGATPENWITDHLLKSGANMSAREYFASIDECNTASGALLPVYFGRADAAVVSMAGYEKMCQHNPGLKDRLHIIGRSKSLANSVICHRPSFADNRPEEVTRVLQSLEKSEEGQRFLKQLGARRIVAFKSDYMLYNQEIATRAAAASSPDIEPIEIEGGAK